MSRKELEEFEKEVLGEDVKVPEVELVSVDKLVPYDNNPRDNDSAVDVAFAQGGDFMGGKEGFGKDIRIKRKAMNTMFCSVDRPFKFLGKHNEDVNTYVSLGRVGKLFFTINAVAIVQLLTQSNEGGMTSSYLDTGTYVKSFYTVMFAPNCVKISMIGNKDRRIHHKINWDRAVPCIIEEKYKKN